MIDSIKDHIDMLLSLEGHSIYIVLVTGSNPDMSNPWQGHYKFICKAKKESVLFYHNTLSFYV